MPTAPYNKNYLDKPISSICPRLESWRVPVQSLVILIIYACSAAIVLTPGLKYTAIILCPFMGFILSGFLNGAHYCIHRFNLSKSWSRVLGVFWSTPLFFNFTITRYHHLIHHKYTGVQGDTDSHATYNSLAAYLYSLTGISVWARLMLRIFRTWKGDLPTFINSNHQRRNVKIDNFIVSIWLVMALILTAFFPSTMLFIYWLPMAFYPAFAVILSMPEHYGLNGVAEIKYNTRSVRSNRFVRFFQWNGNYHAEHHTFPSIPTLSLRSLHNIGFEFSQNNENSYIGFHIKFIKNFILKRDACLKCVDDTHTNC